MNKSIPSTMQAMVLTGHGGYDKLRFESNHPTPQPGAGEVLIEVHACGLNNTDINTRIGWYSKGVQDATTEGGQNGARPDDAGWGGATFTFPRIQGADAVGTVVQTGDGAEPSLLGQRVMIDTWLRGGGQPDESARPGFFGSEIDGGFAQFTVVNALNAHPVNSSLSDAELATFATSYSTAENMLTRAEVTDRDTVLITGASGGVGSALVQLARRRGAQVIALCGEHKREQVAALGPAAVLPRTPRDLAGALGDATGKREVSVVADVVGGVLFEQLIQVLAPGGRYTCAGAIAGPIVSLDLRTFYLNDLTFTGATFVPSSVFARLVDIIETGQIQPLLAQTFALRDLREAQRVFLAKRHVGNIVVEPEPVYSTS